MTTSVLFLSFAKLAIEAFGILNQDTVQEEICSNQLRARKRKRTRNVPPKYFILDKISERLAFLERISQDANKECFKNLRMSSLAFNELCRVLRDDCGLNDDQYVTVVEKVAIFLRILAHHQKNRILQSDFQRSGQTISKSFHQVLRAVLKLRSRLLAQPQPVDGTTDDRRWKCFEGCVGALDGTYIPLHVPTVDAPRYRTRKGHIASNVLGVCDTRGFFMYMLVGWEGSAADSRVLRDALTRINGLRVQNGTYFLCDSGYMNGPGFLTPYRQTRYHLQEWATSNKRPQNAKELFNLRHSSARNVIERTFGILKKRFAVLRSPTFYPVDTQCDIILACGLLHNFVMKVTPLDPLLDQTADQAEDGAPLSQEDNTADYVIGVHTSPAWNQFRDTLAHDLWNNFNSSGTV